jgi:hypothetical protein
LERVVGVRVATEVERNAIKANEICAAVEAEREACAGEAEAHEDIHELNGDDEFVCGRNLCAMIIAAAIRARGESDD